MYLLIKLKLFQNQLEQKIKILFLFIKYLITEVPLVHMNIWYTGKITMHLMLHQLEIVKARQTLEQNKNVVSDDAVKNIVIDKNIVDKEDSDIQMNLYC